MAFLKKALVWKSGTEVTDIEAGLNCSLGRVDGIKRRTVVCCRRERSRKDVCESIPRNASS